MHFAIWRLNGWRGWRVEGTPPAPARALCGASDPRAQPPPLLCLWLLSISSPSPQPHSHVVDFATLALSHIEGTVTLEAAPSEEVGWGWACRRPQVHPLPSETERNLKSLEQSCFKCAPLSPEFAKNADSQAPPIQQSQRLRFHEQSAALRVRILGECLA